MAVLWLIILMMEAASTSEMSANFYQTTYHYNPEDTHLHTHCHENLKHDVFQFPNIQQISSIILT
jgi:hypothetical protein